MPVIYTWIKTLILANLKEVRPHAIVGEWIS
nr:MAG TPA: hypothetical protein [Caudoviricetes sp.]